MRMSESIFRIRHVPHPMARPLALAALLVILALSIGGALAERLEQRAAQDRLTIGDATEQG